MELVEPDTERKLKRLLRYYVCEAHNSLFARCITIYTIWEG